MYPHTLSAHILRPAIAVNAISDGADSAPHLNLAPLSVAAESKCLDTRAFLICSLRLVPRATHF